MDGSHSLLFRSDSSLALRCRKGAIHPIIQLARQRGQRQFATLEGEFAVQWRVLHPNAVGADGRGSLLSRTYLVGKNGAEPLSKFPLTWVRL